jgi:hypothetical protein
MKEALSSSETSVLTRATRRNIPEDAILHSHLREILKIFDLFLVFHEWRLIPSLRYPRKTWAAGWVDPSNGIYYSERRESLLPSGLEVWPLGRPAHSQFARALCVVLGIRRFSLILLCDIGSQCFSSAHAKIAAIYTIPTVLFNSSSKTSKITKINTAGLYTIYSASFSK